MGNNMQSGYGMQGGNMQQGYGGNNIQGGMGNNVQSGNNQAGMSADQAAQLRQLEMLRAQLAQQEQLLRSKGGLP
jgi:hypothetical protein